MAAGVGQIIDDSDYAIIKAKVDLIFGVSSGQSGYGQNISSPTLVANTTATAAQWLALRTDMVKAKQHQTGVAVGTSDALDGNNLLVPVSVASNVRPLMNQSETAVDPAAHTVSARVAAGYITDALRNQYSLFADVLATNKFDVAPSQLSTEVLVVGTRTTAWNGVLTHSVVITGSTTGNTPENNLRFFFNAGGSIRITASRAGGTTTPKNTSWTTLLSEMGAITMDYTSTTYSGVNGIVSANIGWFDLTTSNQLIFQKNASAGYYSSNRYFIYARTNSIRSQLILTIQFADYDTGVTGHTPGHAYLTDENITGVLTSQITQIRPSGNNVSIPSHTASQSGL